ncbi:MULTISPECIES: nicotianamine synthase family protein [Methanobacterium]|jgi:hypothetical protein|uniref:Nicotianamine synthase family protein n=1 Tax=Methanobacterium veterum TaxID=408577 RepID=A0A9E4ZZF2_9EURY|nr:MULTISPECIES: nicotianamine synthase family protein [Methanobacterium]MCZ3367157.1 nicotianamine synthase family protein [Methanobacterium veterum]MCZ3373695.1 nicotianamine synthase family protein [Methanobacterium veterum]
MSCYKYWGNIVNICKSLEKYDGCKIGEYPLEEVIPILDAVEIIAHDESIDFDSAKHILENERMNQALKTIRKFYVDVGTNLEIDKAKEILEAEDPWAKLSSFHFYHRYEKLVNNEENLAKFSKGDKLVFIGGGPLPLTIIMFNKFFGVKGTSIEVVPEIADLSRKVLEKLGLSSQINVVDGDETVLSHMDYDGVMVAAFAEPKMRVFEHVHESVEPETKILYRTYSGMRAILYTPIKHDDLDGFMELGRVFPTGKVNNTSVLIRKIT